MFTIRNIIDNTFMIVKKDSLEGEFFKNLPIEVYGFIKVEVFKNTFGLSFMNISEEVFQSEDLLKLIEEAKKI